MIRKSIFNIILVCAAALLSIAVPHADAADNGNAEQESMIQSLAALQIPAVFNKLKEPYFKADRDLSREAILAAFGNRRQEALAVAEHYLKELIVEVVEGQRINRAAEFDVAKQVFQAFPIEAEPHLAALYLRSDSITRGNIIRVVGGIKGGAAISNILISALNDVTFANEEDPEDLGEPLRVCDIAYNQIVLRYNIRNVLRTISPALNIENRNYQLDILKGNMSQYIH